MFVMTIDIYLKKYKTSKCQLCLTNLIILHPKVFDIYG